MIPLKTAQARKIGALLAAAGLIAGLVVIRPLRKLPDGIWLALPDGTAKAVRYYFAWQESYRRSGSEPFIAELNGPVSRDAIPVGIRFTGKLRPVKTLSLAGAGDDFTARFVRQYLAPLSADFSSLTGEELLARGASAQADDLRKTLTADGFAVESINLQLIAPASFAEAYGRKVVRENSRPPAAPLLWIGYDGADWAIIHRLMAQGKLPNLRRLMKAGAWGRMRPFQPIISPLLWTTMVTGKTPAEHGITDFVVKTADGQMKSIGSNYRLVKSIWEIAPLAQRKVAFIDWWASFPAEETTGGVILSNALRQVVSLPGLKGGEGVTSPAAYYSENHARLARNYAAGPAEMAYFTATSEAELRQSDIKQQKATPKEGKKMKHQETLQVLRDTVSLTRGHTAEAVRLLKNLKPDLLAIYYEGIDMVGHRFQHCMAPPLKICPPEDVARFGETVDRFYQYQDDALGELLAALPGPSYVLLVSDHGFLSGAERPTEKLPYTDENPVAWHREEGVFLLSGPGIKPGELPLAVSIYDFMPTVLYLMGMPVADDFKGDVARTAFQEEFLRAHPVRRVKSYEELGPPHVMAKGVSNPEVEKEILANLARLGYISPSSTLTTGGSAPATTGGNESMTEGSHITKAKFLLAAGDYAGALAELDKLESEKNKGRVVSLRAKAMDGLGHKAAAASLLRQALADKEGEAGSLIWLIQLRITLNDFAAAEAELREFKPVEAKTEAQTEAETEAQALSVWNTAAGLLHEARGDTAAAKASYWAALKVDALQSTAAEHLFGLLKPAEQAEFSALLQTGLKEKPGIGEYHFMLGALAQQSARAAEALEQLRRAVDAEPLQDRFVTAYAASLAAAGRAAEAESLLEGQTTRHPGNPELWETLGNLRGRRRDFSGAAAAFQKARDAGGEGPRLFAGLAATLAQTGRREEAKKVIAEGLRRHPGDPALLGVQKQLAR